MKAFIHFDTNEWFIIITALLVAVIFLLLPRRFSFTQIVVIFVLNLFFGEVGDKILAGPPYDFYDVMGSPLFEWGDAVTYLFHYPMMMYFFLYFHDKWQPRKLPFIGYLIGWIVMTIAWERIAALFHVFTYNHWGILDSFVVYFLAYSFNLIVFKFTERYVGKATP